MEFLELVLPYVLEILACAAITAIGVCGAYLTAKAAEGKKLTNIAAAIEQVTNAAQSVVGDLKQTVVDTWKEQASDGKLTSEQIAQLNSILLEKTKAQLATPILTLLEAAAVDVNALIKSAGENAVLWINDQTKQIA